MPMTNSKLTLLLFVIAASVAGCKSTADNPTKDRQPDSAAAFQLAKAKAATAEAAVAMDDYAYARKAEFVATMNKELGILQDDLNLLGTKVENSSGAVKADAKAKLEVVREKWVKTRQQLNQAENATDSTWNDVKSGFKGSYADLKDSIAATRQWLSEKIAP
jgi:predicted  nucleic acid-binding Zn-ribbon protein